MRTVWLALPVTITLLVARGVQPPDAPGGAARLAARADPERRARLAARAPARGDRAAISPRSPKAASRRRCRSSARSAATSWPPSCTGSIARCPRSAPGAPRPTACCATLLDALPDPLLRGRRAPRRRQRQSGGRAAVRPRPGRPSRSRRACAIRAFSRRSTRRCRATARPSSPCSCRGRRRARSGSRSCRSSCARAPRP